MAAHPLPGRIRASLAIATVACATLAGLPVQMLAVRTGYPSPRLVPRLWHRMALKLLGIRVRVHGRPEVGRPLLLAANHVSWSDICVLGAIADVSFVAKSDMAGWPLFGLLAKLQRTVFVERERRRSAGEQANALARRLAAGDVMVLFAEGTTSDGNQMLPFKSTLFGAAQHALGNGDGLERVLIQPVTIAYTRLHGMPMGRQHRPHAAWIGDSALVPHIGSLLTEGGMDAEVHFGSPVAFERGSDRKHVARTVEGEVRSKLAAVLRDPSPSHRRTKANR